MDLLMLESTMEDSYVYKSFNASNGLIEKMIKYIKTGVPLTSDYFGEQYFQMKKVHFSPLSKAVVEAYDNGKIEILYSKEAVVGKSIPFIIRKNEKGQIIATIFINKFASLEHDDTLNIPVKQLYALMEAAFIAWVIQVNPMKIQRNVGLMKICAYVYSQMFIRILNKEYAIVLDKSLCDKVTYVITRFFLEKVWEYPNKGLIESYASNDLEFISDIDLELTKSGYDAAQITNLNDMLVYLKSISPRMSDLNTRYFIERFINTYHGSSILALDYLPYLFFVITSVLLGSFLISQNAIGDIIKNTKGINKFYSELSKTIGVY